MHCSRPRPLHQAQAAETERSFEIYGFAEADAIYDFGRMNPNWDDAYRPSQIANPEGEFGSDGQASVSVKQSRFGVKGTMPTADGYDPITFKFEFDLFGVGANAGQTTFRLRHAYGEWGSLLAGQTNSIFMDIDVFPNVIDYWGPDGMVFWRNVQIRWTPWKTEHSSFAIGIEEPSNDVDTGQAREFDPTLPEGIQSDEKVPNLAAHWNTSGDWGHVQVAGILRDLGYDTKDTKNNKPKGSVTGWGVNLSGSINVFEKDKILLQYVYGHGIASYMNDGGMDLAPQGAPSDRDGSRRQSASRGGSAHRHRRLLRSLLERQVLHVVRLQHDIRGQHELADPGHVQEGPVHVGQPALHPGAERHDRRRVAVGRPRGEERRHAGRRASPVHREVQLGQDVLSETEP